MRLHHILISILAVLAAMPATSQETEAPAPAATPELSVHDVSYTVGVLFGRQLIYGDELIDTAIVAKAMQDVFAKGEFEMTDEQMQSVLDQLSGVMQKNRADEFSAVGAQFLESRKQEEGVKVTGSGLMYKVLQEGTGDSPQATDMVRVHYTGTFTDGSEFDSSAGGDPVEFQLNQVIPGWTEGLQLMKEGAKFEFYIPYTLAYGESGAPQGGIPPYATLVFQVELLDVLDPAAAN